MLKKFLLSLMFIVYATQASALIKELDSYFKVDMNMELPDLSEYHKKLSDMSQLYDKGYSSRFEMGRTFKKEFSKVIKSYGLGEGRIKKYYEDELLELISWLPKEAYQYIGPMLHEVPGMSEKILNLPGIKETKNKFPERIADEFKGMEGIEYLSPALYFILMPEIWEEKKPSDLDKPQKRQVNKPKIDTELPDFLKEKIGIPVKTAEKKPGSAQKKAALAQRMNLRTPHPSLTTPLTAKDVEAFISTIDMVMDWGTKNYMKNYSRLIVGEAILNMWEQENKTALYQNDLKDIVNPCQRLVLKTRFSDLYDDFSNVVAQEGFSPEEWAYTCDRTLKAFRVATASMGMAYAVRYYRRGYYHEYMDKLPPKWRDRMYTMEDAFVRMYVSLPEEVEIVRPYKEKISEKLIKIHNVMLTAPIIY